MKIFPKEAKFFDNFERLALKIAEGGTLLYEIVTHDGDVDAKSARLKIVEHEADEIANTIYLDLHATFITPLDREDIFNLVTTMDDIMDMIESAATNFSLYRPKRPSPEFVPLTTILRRSIELISNAVTWMSHAGENASAILATCIDINSLENEADQILHRGLRKLFDEEHDVVELIKVKEILENIEEATDICEDVSNIIEGIILKYA